MNFEPARFSSLFSRVFVGALAPLLVTVAGCSSGSEDDETAGNEAAQTASSDLLTKCPALENVDFQSVVVADASVLVRQTYMLARYDANGGRLSDQRFTTAGVPSTVYSLKFYRDAAGKTKFRLAIGTWSGMQGSIEGNAKQLVTSGTITAPDEATTDSGELVSVGRRDALTSIVGDVSKFKFSNLDCQSASTVAVTVPLVTLEKASRETVELTDPAGTKLRVAPLVQWTKRAGEVTLKFDVPAG